MCMRFLLGFKVVWININMRCIEMETDELFIDGHPD